MLRRYSIRPKYRVSRGYQAYRLTAYASGRIQITYNLRVKYIYLSFYIQNQDTLSLFNFFLIKVFMGFY